MTVGKLTTIKVKLKNEEEEKNAIVPSTQAFIELVQQKVQEGNVIDLKQKKTNILVRISDTLFSLLPTIMIVGLFIFVLKNAKDLEIKVKYMMPKAKRRT